MIKREFVHKGNIPTNILRSIKFFSIAEGGAMGSPGEFIAISHRDDTVIYCGNYCYGDLDYSDVVRFFSPLKQFKPGMFGDNSVAPKGWVYGNLGMGNHLLIRESVYTDFKNLVGDKENGELYQAYLDCALRVLGHTEA